MNWDNIPLQRHLELNRLCKQLLLTYSKSWFEIDLKICKQLFSAFLQKHNLWKYKHIILLVIYFNIKRIKIDFITSLSIFIVFLTSVLYGYAVFLIDMVSLTILQIFFTFPTVDFKISFINFWQTYHHDEIWCKISYCHTSCLLSNWFNFR